MTAAPEEPDPPAEIMAVLADDERVETEIDRAGEAVDTEFPREAAVRLRAARYLTRLAAGLLTMNATEATLAAAPGPAQEEAAR